MSHFRLLRDPASYVAHDWDLVADSSARKHWLDHFAQHFEVMLSHAATQYGRKAARSVAAAREQFAAALEKLRKDPASLPGGRLNIYELCRLRDTTLRTCGLADPFKAVKDRENASAAALYPTVVRKLHAMTGKERWLHLVKCVFAGNVFDLGSQATMHLAVERTDFLAAVADRKARPWLIDDFDRLAEDLKAVPPAPWGKVLVFVDNAGSDFVLGVMPLARELALAGARIVLAANELPSLNDITADETAAVLAQLGAADDDLAALLEAEMFEVVSTGNGSPLIDLSEVSEELNEAAGDVELVVLVGMGRAVESNLDAHFTVSALHLALLKDAAVAKRVGGELFDCVCKYTPAGQ
jgi:uncharacterized protein with ATP-grasp and redox domains